jgi:hypothetical protein
MRLTAAGIDTREETREPDAISGLGCPTSNLLGMALTILAGAMTTIRMMPTGEPEQPH